ncbi:MAG: hypothetical protein KC428_07305 [Flavobacteriales bacterium]|nr:hypothetical protein [Flavobacteriales bacterium]
MKNDTSSRRIGTQEEAAGLHMTALPVGQKDPHPKQGYRCRSCTTGEELL